MGFKIPKHLKNKWVIFDKTNHKILAYGDTLSQTIHEIEEKSINCDFIFIKETKEGIYTIQNINTLPPNQLKMTSPTP